MSRTEAHTILNAAKGGLEITRALITEALVATGDMSPPVVQPIAPPRTAETMRYELQ